jgi:hypothetical protein
MLARDNLKRSGTWCVGAIAMALLMGVLSTRADHWENHPQQPERTSCRHTTAGREATECHLVPKNTDSQNSTCSVCFFQKLLSQTLIPDEEIPACAEVSSQTIAVCQDSFFALRVSPEAPRGPPSC